jgi:hypothetical protein
MVVQSEEATGKGRTSRQSFRNGRVRNLSAGRIVPILEISFIGGPLLVLPGTGMSPPVLSDPLGGLDMENRMEFTHSDAIEVKRIKGKGRGVFARRPIRKGEVIERVPVLVLSIEEVRNCSGWTGLAGYCFDWGRGTVALALGYGSLYNHSYRPNARYDDVSRQTKVFTALRGIVPGEEITVNYNGEPKDRSPLGFKVIETTASKNGRASLDESR